MDNIDDDLAETFRRLGIRQASQTPLPRNVQRDPPYSDVDNATLLRVLRRLGPMTFPEVIVEIRRRGLMDEFDLQSWLDDDPDGPRVRPA